MTAYDLIVIGAGANGSAAAYHAAQRGQRVALVEQFEIDHQRGSSHGRSRIIRYSYDLVDYIRLSKAVYPMWEALEAEAGESLLLQRVGGIDIGRADMPDITRRVDVLTQEGIGFEVLSAPEVTYRYPQFRLQDDQVALFQAETGVLRASACVLAHVQLALARGAALFTGVRVTGIEIVGTGVAVRLADGTRLEAARLIVAANGWTNDLLGPHEVTLPLQTLHCQENYFAAAPAADYEVGRFPAFIAHVQDEWGTPAYGIPSVDGTGLKVAWHSGPAISHPDAASQQPLAETSNKARAFARQYIPGGDAPLVYSRQCLYTMTPDEHFVIDRHPQHPQIVIGACCSGHAFKFSTLIGSILVDLALDGATAHDISLFSLARFTS